jgi:carbonic anhydrase
LTLLILVLTANFGFSQEKGEKCLAVGKCHELHRQSPINLKPNGKHLKTQVKFDYHPSHEVVLNNGHTIELLYDGGSTITFQNKAYQLIQFHFHTPSDHHNHGKSYPMEVHLVHIAADSAVLVVGLFFEEGAENQFLTQFLGDAPNEEAKIKVNKTINVNQLLPKKRHFYHYAGSLTTPPYTEGVSWLVFQNSVSASKNQIDRMRILEGFNSRVNQPLNHREVFIIK